MLEVARLEVEKILEADLQLSNSENFILKNFLAFQKGKTTWSKIS